MNELPAGHLDYQSMEFNLEDLALLKSRVDLLNQALQHIEQGLRSLIAGCRVLDERTQELDKRLDTLAYYVDAHTDILEDIDTRMTPRQPNGPNSE